MSNNIEGKIVAVDATINSSAPELEKQGSESLVALTRAMGLLKPDEARHIDEIVEGLELELSSSEIFAALFELELEGEIKQLPVAQVAAAKAHLYLWCPNALLPKGLAVMKAWGFTYKSNLVWHKVRRDGGSDGRGVGFYFRNVTELILFGVRGKNARTLAPGRRQVNLLATRKREHSRKPDEQYQLIEACSPAPYLELFARGTRKGWTTWGNEADDGYRPTWKTYAHHSAAARMIAAE